jgi:hypothetical protein
MVFGKIDPWSKSTLLNGGVALKDRRKFKTEQHTDHVLSQIIKELSTKTKEEMEKDIADVRNIGTRLKSKQWTPEQKTTIRKLSHHWKKFMKKFSGDSAFKKDSFLKFSSQVDRIFLQEEGCRKEAGKLLKQIKLGIEMTRNLPNPKIRRVLQQAFENLTAGRRSAYKDLICGGTPSDFKKALRLLNIQAKKLQEEAKNAEKQK